MACSDAVRSGIAYRIIFMTTLGSVFYLIKRKSDTMI